MKYFLLLLIFFLINIGAHAQIYSQGININKKNIYSISLELVKESDKYLAKIDFYGSKKNLNYYLKNDNGIEHKTFIDYKEMIVYMERRNWILYDKKDNKYYFRKNMSELSN